MDAVADAHDINLIIEYIAERKARHKKKRSKTHSETPDDETSDDEEEDECKSADAMYHSFFHQQDDQRTVIEHNYALNRWMAAQRGRKMTVSPSPSPTPVLPEEPSDEAAADPLELDGADGNVLV